MSLRSKIVALLFLSLFICCSHDASVTPPANEPACSVKPSSLGFGAVTVGQSADMTFSIQNTGSGTLTGTVLESCSDFEIVGSPSYNLTAGQSAMFTVRFSPTSQGSTTCTIEMGTADCERVQCTGTGELSIGCQVIPSLLDFGRVPKGGSKHKWFSVQNTGSRTFSGTVSAHCEAYSIDYGGGAYSLSLGQTWSVRVLFTPEDDCEPRPCTVSVGNSNCADAICTGEAMGMPCQASPGTLNFETVTKGESKDMTFQITNRDCRISSGVVYKDTTSPGGGWEDFTIISGGGSYTLNPDESRTVTVRFTPSTVGGSCWIVPGSPLLCPPVLCFGLGEE